MARLCHGKLVFVSEIAGNCWKLLEIELTGLFSHERQSSVIEYCIIDFPQAA